MTPTEARLDFLRHAGYDLTPDKRNIPHLIESGWTNHQVAEVYGVSVRTVQRYLRDPHQCPGYPEGSCVVQTPGGRLCHFCRRTRARAA